MSREITHENLYKGLLSLDNLHPAIKVINFVVTIIIGIGTVFFSVITFGYKGVFISPNSLFSWPYIFVFGWPISGVILWLRLSGIKWIWSVFAGILVIIFFEISEFLLQFFLRLLIPT